MNEEKNTPLDGSVFAHVLGRLMSAHLRHVDKEKALDLAEFSGLDREVFRARLHGDTEANPGDLSQLSEELSLSEYERQALATAYAFERDRESLETTTEEEFKHLTESVGFTYEEAERALRDDDLWVVLPEQRLEVPDEEAVTEWREAYYALGDLVQIADRINQATLTAVMDAQARAEIALKRAKARVREASTE